METLHLENLELKGFAKQFQDLLEKYAVPEEEKIQILDEFEKKPEKYSRRKCKEIADAYTMTEEDFTAFMKEFTNSKNLSGQFQDLLEKYAIPEDEKKTLFQSLQHERQLISYSSDELDQIFDTYSVDIADRYAFVKIFSKFQKEEMRKAALPAAIAAIMSRNMSHSIGRNMLLSKTDPDFVEFVQFCNPNFKMHKQGENRYHDLFMQDYPMIKNHPFNLRYQELRKEGKNVVDALQSLPRMEEAAKNMMTASILPTNAEMLEGSKMGDLEYCLGRMNTILGILALNEGIEFVDNQVRYAEVIKDGLEDILQKMVPVGQRDTSYLNEALNYEDPHYMLIIQESGKEIEIDPNHITLKQRGIELKNEVLKYEGKTSYLAYEIYYLNYINEKLQKNPNLPNRAEILERMENLDMYL